MKREDQDLVEAAEAVFGGFRLREDFSAGTVGAAIRTAAGSVYTGICIDLGCGLGFCAEVAAMAEMLKHRETMAQVDARNLRCRVLLPAQRETTLADLLPEHWLENQRGSAPGGAGNA